MKSKMSAMLDSLIKSKAGKMEWPEGNSADPELARARYESDIKADRAALRDALRADMPAAHFGLMVVLAVGVVGFFVWGPIVGAAVLSCFAALFLVVFGFVIFRGVHGLDAARRAYLFTFGWGNWF
ncbi:hypothetical protein [Streptomyces sp. NBC_00073]|uniref:hypothetical protein n=1 Tax=Streptomyces sp. NBC_00073 TaxID=2975640 RepID=UPI00324341AF